MCYVICLTTCSNNYQIIETLVLPSYSTLPSFNWKRKLRKILKNKFYILMAQNII